MTRHLLVASLLVVAACAPKAETAEQMQARMNTESATAKTAISGLSTSFATHMSAGHTDSVVNMYTEDAMLMPPNMPAVSGRDGIRTWMAANAFPQGATFTLTTTDVTANGPLALERGTFSIAMPAMGHNPAMTVQGKYLAAWKLMHGSWQMVDDIWNENAASMPMAPPPAARH